MRLFIVWIFSFIFACLSANLIPQNKLYFDKNVWVMLFKWSRRLTVNLISGHGRKMKPQQDTCPYCLAHLSPKLILTW